MKEKIAVRFRNLPQLNTDIMKNIELCEALNIVYGHNQWWNPLRPSVCMPVINTPFQAYSELTDHNKRIVEELIGGKPSNLDGMLDDSAPIEFDRYFPIGTKTSIDCGNKI